MQQSVPPNKRLIQFAGVLLTVFVLMLTGCDSLLAKYVVATPNLGKSLAQVDRPRPLALPGTVIDHEFRIAGAGPGDVSLLVWVIEPHGEKLVDAQAKPFPTFEPAATGTPILPPRGTILLVHGFYDSMNQVRYLMWGRIFAAAGYRAVLLDMRGHGRSTGSYVTFGASESKDLSAVLQTLEQQKLLQKPLGVMAVSMGAAAAMRFAERDSRVEALVLLSAFTAMRDVVPDFGRAIGFKHFKPERYQHIVELAAARAGIDADDASLIDRIGNIQKPILLIHGEDDRLIPIQHALRLWQAGSRDTVQLLRVHSSDHTSLGDDVAEPLREPILRFLGRHLETASAP